MYPFSYFTEDMKQNPNASNVLRLVCFYQVLFYPSPGNKRSSTFFFFFSVKTACDRMSISESLPVLPN